MKLGALKAAIRDLKVAPKAIIRFGCDKRTLYLDLQKATLLAQLDETFPGGRAASNTETGFDLSADGFLSHVDELTPETETITISVKEYRMLLEKDRQACLAGVGTFEAEPADEDRYGRLGQG